VCIGGRPRERRTMVSPTGAPASSGAVTGTSMRSLDGIYQYWLRCIHN
jgi:hypothetical protein